MSRSSIGLLCFYYLVAAILFASFEAWLTFDPDDVAVVKAAFAKSGKRYPGDVISDCARVMVGLKP
jgi:hypothetical protein